jgi:hypothetical protein
MSSLAANSIIGNNTGSAATPLALTTAQVKTMLALTGTNSGDQIITLTGDVTGSGTGSFAATIPDNTITAAKIASNAITAAKISTGALTLAKMEPIGMQTFMGNSSNLSSLYPEAMSTAIAKTLLGLTGTNSGDQTITLTGDVTGSGTGSFAATIGSSSVSLAKMANLAANSIIGNNTASSTTPVALTASQVKTLLSLSNVENTALSTWAGSTNITTVGALSSGSLASGFGTVNCGAITSDSITAKTLNANLTLNASGSGAIVTNNKTIYMAAGTGDSALGIDGTNTGNSRYIATYQNTALKCSFGLSSTFHYFIYDVALNNDMFKAVLGGGQCIRFPTYTNGSLSITTGGVLSSSSDRRLKMNEQLLIPSNSLQKIMNLQPKSFEWIADPGRTEIGFIAQDVELVIPDGVDGKKYEFDFIRDGAASGVEGVIRLDESGNPVLDQTKPRYRGLNQCAILSTLVSAFQCLIEKNNALEAKLANLQTQLGIQL